MLPADVRCAAALARPQLRGRSCVAAVARQQCPVRELAVSADPGLCLGGESRAAGNASRWMDVCERETDA